MAETRVKTPEEVARTLRSRLTIESQPKKPTRLAGPQTESKSRIGRQSTLPPPPPSEEAPGPRYVFMNELGRGGMGRVDEVFDNLLGRSIAQKCALGEGGDGYATMLVSEAQTCAQLEHPAIVPVYDIGVAPDGAPYYTMRRVRGRTLYDVLRDTQKPASKPQLLAVLRQICLAVDYAHSRGVVHRDLKPENVIVGEFGEVYVLDWGIAEVLEGSNVKRVLKESISAGSPGYMAPEQIRGGRVDARTDVFALGAMLYEALSGFRLFEDEDHQSLVSRSTGDVPSTRYVPPGVLGSSRLESLVRSCIEVSPDRRPGSARFLADAIDEHLDGEKQRYEREQEADALTAEGDAVWESYIGLEAESRRLADEAEEELAKLAPWEGVEKKAPVWNKQAEGRRMASEAARTLARAETAYLRALGRVENHEGARAGMARLHFRQFEDAENHRRVSAGTGDGRDAERMAQHLDLARTYDDGPLALELANEGELVVECTAPDAKLEIARYEPRGWLLELGRSLPIKPGDVRLLEVGSWMVIARRGKREIRYPVLVGRAKRHHVRLVWKDVPEGMILIPGGPFLAPGPSRQVKMLPYELPDFAIGQFPVTMGEYAKFLDTLSPAEQKRRVPHIRGEVIPVLEKRKGKWRLTENVVEGEDAKARVPADRELDLPVESVSWFDAVAYCEWMRKMTGLPYRLPTSLEWDKAARGVDGRPFPMGLRFDPSLAKLRESRPEASQPELVGVFRTDISPYQVRDVTGGVQDWTATVRGALTPPPLADEHLAGAQAIQGVIRGGSWTVVHIEPLIGRTVHRLIDRAGWVGFRLALDTTEDPSCLQVTGMKR